MKRFIPWIGGLLIGLVLSGIVAGSLLLRSAFGNQADPAYELVAVSWGTPGSSPDAWIYQIQVIATDDNKDGILDVSAKGCIGSSSYCHDFGRLGTASDMGQAVREFGAITWGEDAVSIGGTSGIKASVKRSQLEKHR
jgi:hypothetical protein